MATAQVIKGTLEKAFQPLCTPEMLDGLLDNIGVAGPEDEMDAQERQLCKAVMEDTLKDFEGQTVGEIKEAIVWWTAGFISAKRMYKG